MHCLSQNTYLLRWKKGLHFYSDTGTAYVKMYFDLYVWNKYKWWDPFFHFLQFKRETGFSDTATQLTLPWTADTTLNWIKVFHCNKTYNYFSSVVELF